MRASFVVREASDSRDASERIHSVLVADVEEDAKDSEALEEVFKLETPNAEGLPEVTNAVLLAETVQQGYLILDNGCKRCVGGPTFHKHLRSLLKKRGLKPVRIDKQEKFKFGDSRIERSVCAWRYPTGIKRHHGELDIAEVQCPCPGLMSDEAMHDLDVSLHTGTRTYDIGRYGISGEPMNRATSGHATVCITDFSEDPQKLKRDFTTYLADDADNRLGHDVRYVGSNQKAHNRTVLFLTSHVRGVRDAAHDNPLRREESSLKA